MRKKAQDALDFCIGNMQDLSDKDWRDHGMRLKDYEDATKWVRSVGKENDQLRAKVAELETYRAMLREIVEAKDLNYTLSKAIEKARGML